MNVRFYATLRPIVGGRSVEIELPEGATLAALVDEVSRRWPPLREQLLDEQGQLSRRVNFFLDGRNARWLEGIATPLAGVREIDVFPPVAGG